jgi:hypothetical protein
VEEESVGWEPQGKASEADGHIYPTNAYLSQGWLYSYIMLSSCDGCQLGWGA